MTKPIEYHKLDYQHKLLYIRSVFEEAQSAHPVYTQLYQLLSGNWKIEEKHLDMLHSQILNVVDSFHTDEIIAKMGHLAARLAHIQQLEQIDRKQEAKELRQLEETIAGMSSHLG